MKSFLILLKEAKAETTKGRVYITQRDNDKYFAQKAKTWRNGFEWKAATITLTDDPSETYDHGEYGVVKLYGAKVYVTSVNGNDWEIEGKVK